MSTRSVVLEILVQDKNSSKVTSRLRQEFGAVEQQVDRTTNAIQKGNNRAAKSTRNFARTQSSANQVLFSYGDLLNDAQQFQYGFSGGVRAIGNNIGFAAEQISNLNTRTGGLRGTLKALGSSLLGPGGVILAINVAVTAMSLFGDSMFSSKKEAEDLNVELKDTNDFLKDIAQNRIDEFLDGFDSTQEKITGIKSAISLLNNEITSLEKQQEGIQKVLRENNKLSDDQRQVLGEQLTQVSGRLNESGEINKLAADILKNKQAELRAQQAIDEVLDGILNKSEEQATKGIDDLISANEKIIDTLLNQQADLSAAQRERLVQLSQENQRLKEQIQLRERIRDIALRSQRNQQFGIQPGDVRRSEGFSPTDVFGGFSGGSTTNTIAQLEDRLKSLREQWRNVARGTEEFRRLKEQIRQTKNELRAAKDEGGDFGDKTTEGLTKAEQAMMQMAAATGQLIGRMIEGQEEGLKFVDVLKAIIPIALTAAPGGQFLAPFVGGILSGFASGTDYGFPGAGIVGERGPEMLIAPPMSTVITNDNVERMDRMRKEARTGANNIMSMNPGNLVQQIRQAMIEAQRQAPAPIVQLRRFDEGLKDERSIESAIGNDV